MNHGDASLDTTLGRRARRWSVIGAGLVLLAAAGCTNAADGAASDPTTEPPVQAPMEHDMSAVEPTYGPSEPRVAHADDSPTMVAGLDTVACLATSEQAGGAYSFVEINIPAGSGPPPHQHHADEFFYVLNGTASIVVGELQAEIGPGDYFHVPRSTTHSITATTDTQMVAGYAPGGEEGPLFCDVAT